MTDKKNNDEKIKEVKEKIAKDIEEQAEEVKEILQDGSTTAEEREQLKGIADKMKNAVNVLRDLNKYTSIEELFNMAKLAIITELDKHKVDEITKFETYLESQKILYGLDEEANGILIVREMIDSYRTNQISKGRKSRREVTEILKEATAENTRNLGRLGIK